MYHYINVWSFFLIINYCSPHRIVLTNNILCSQLNAIIYIVFQGHIQSELASSTENNSSDNQFSWVRNQKKNECSLLTITRQRSTSRKAAVMLLNWRLGLPPKHLEVYLALSQQSKKRVMLWARIKDPFWGENGVVLYNGNKENRPRTYIWLPLGHLLALLGSVKR